MKGNGQSMTALLPKGYRVEDVSYGIYHNVDLRGRAAVTIRLSATDSELSLRPLVALVASAHKRNKWEKPLIVFTGDTSQVDAGGLLSFDAFRGYRTVLETDGRLWKEGMQRHHSIVISPQHHGGWWTNWDDWTNRYVMKDTVVFKVRYPSTNQKVLNAVMDVPHRAAFLAYDQIGRLTEMEEYVKRDSRWRLHVPMVL